MAPSQSERRQEARAAIQAAALSLFAERGFEATSVKAIADRAGVSKGLVHHYFPTKDELVIGVVTARQQAVAAQLAEAPEGLAPVERIAWWIPRVVDDVARDPASFRLLLRAMCDPTVHARVQQLVAPSEAWVQAFEEAGVADARARAGFVRAALLGVLTALATAHEPPDPEDLARSILALLPVSR